MEDYSKLDFVKYWKRQTCDSVFCGVLGILPLAGLRTLWFAVAEISESDFEEWRAVYQRASTSVQNRLLNLEESYEMIEKVRGFVAYRKGIPQVSSLSLPGDQ